MFNLDELIHLTANDITAIHDDILRELPGLKGHRPNQSVDALAGRIHHNLTDQSFNSIEEVAALYAEVIAKGHVFNDGNKRTSLLCMLAFLDLNGYALHAPDQDELADKIVDIAESRLKYKEFATWIRPRLAENT